MQNLILFKLQLLEISHLVHEKLTHFTFDIDDMSSYPLDKLVGDVAERERPEQEQEMLSDEQY